MNLGSKVKEIEFNKVVATCAPDTKVSDVINTLVGKHIGSIVIIENNKVKGIFTERDFLFKMGMNVQDFKDKPISELMTPNPKCVSDNTSVTDVLNLMHEGKFRHMIITDIENNLVGICSIKDLMEFLISTIENLEENMSDLVKAII